MKPEGSHLTDCNKRERESPRICLGPDCGRLLLCTLITPSSIQCQSGTVWWLHYNPPNNSEWSVCAGDKIKGNEEKTRERERERERWRRTGWLVLAFSPLFAIFTTTTTSFLSPAHWSKSVEKWSSLIWRCTVSDKGCDGEAMFERSEWHLTLTR